MAENTLDATKCDERYEALKKKRDQYLNRAKEYAKVTLPYLLPENEDMSASEMQTDYNSVGAELVNHLANRYMQELFPAARSFFKLRLDDKASKEVSDATGTSKAGQDKAFAEGERMARWQFEERHARASILDALKHCIVAGNSCLYWPAKDKGFVQNYALDEYVILRGLDGKLVELITLDKKILATLDPDLKSAAMATMDLKGDEDLSQLTAKLYTWVRINPDDPLKYDVVQAIEKAEVPDSVQQYPADLLPWIPLVWHRTRREIYGRGLVEDYYGSFYGLSVLTEAMVTGAAVMADFKFFVKPGSAIDIPEMNSSASGTYHYGDPDDIGTPEVGKSRDLKFIFDIVNWYKQTLGKAFLQVSSQMRDAERVTAEETRIRAQELETAHGGVFSNFAMSLQKPIAALLLRDINVSTKGSQVKTVIVTGLDAMGRSADNEKILWWFNDLAALKNVPEPFQQRMKPSDLMAVLANGRDVDASVVVYTEDEFKTVAAEQAKLQNAAIAGQEMVKKASTEQIAEGLANSQ